MMPTSLKYRPDIDGLRAIAVLLVVVFHFDLIPGGKSGFLGVDVFFVISGFLITAIITKQLDAGSFSFSSFYLHRIRRLAPALFAVLFLVMLAGLLLLLPHELVELSKQVLASQLYVANIFYWKTINYFGLKADNVHLLHTWSLAVEEQFYLFYPLAIVVLHRYLRRQFWTVLALGFVASFGLNLWMVAAKPEATFYLLPTRAWELLAGSLAFHASTRFARSRTTDELLGLVGIGLITTGVVTFYEGVKFPGSFALLPTLGAAFLIVGGSAHRTTMSRVLSAPVAVYIGRISYTLYLVHWPIHVFAKQIFEDAYITQARAAMFALSIILSSAIFHMVESPVRGGRYLSSGAGIAKSYAAGLAVTFVLVSAAIVSQGLPQRFPAEVIRLASFANDRNDDIPHCEFQGKPLITADQFCRIGVKGKEPTWLVVGDSHAWAGHAAFDKWLTGEGKAGLFMFRNSCPPISGIHIFRDKGLCHAFNKAVTAFLDHQDSIRNVLWVSTWRQATEGRLSTNPDLKLSRNDSVKLFEDNFAASLNHLHRTGKRIYVWEPLPGARHEVPIALAKAVRQGIPVDIEIAREEYFREFDFFFRSLRAQQDVVTQSFSPSAVLCGSGKCEVVANGNPLYFDNAHVTKSSADFWAAMLTDQYRRGRVKSPQAPF